MRSLSARVLRLPPLTSISALLYALTALALVVAVIDYAPGKNPQWVLGLLGALAAAMTACVLARGPRFTAVEATVLLAVYLAAIASLTHTTSLDLGALSNGLSLPLLGVYAGWLLPRWSAIVYYLGLVAWLAAIFGRGNGVMSVLALVVVSEAAIMTEIVRVLTVRITRLMYTDTLTGTLNRPGVLRRGKQLVETAHRAGTPLALAIIDLDDLRRVNNSAGHHAGDELLARAAQEWASLGEDVTIGRVGGDEFLMIFPETTAEQARALVARLRASASVRWTAGIEELQRADTLDSLSRRADRAMYRGKEARS